MFLYLQPLFSSLFFALGLELVVNFPQTTGILFWLLIIVALWQGRKIGGAWFFSILPTFLSFSSVALLYLIGLWYERQIFVVIISLMYYLALFGAYRLSRSQNDRTAQGLNNAASFAALFSFYASAYGLYLNFSVPLWVLIFAYMGATLLVSAQYFFVIGAHRETIWIYAFVLALGMTEIVWILNFWPFGYLTTGVIALILYYVLWDLSGSYFLANLSQKKVVFQLILCLSLAVLVLVTSRWTPTGIRVF